MEGPRTEPKRACETYIKWSSPCIDGEQTFRVHLVTPWDPRLVHDFGYACNCPEFRSQPGACIHILTVKGYHCGWHEAFDTEKLEDSAKCPRCSKATVQVRYTP